MRGNSSGVALSCARALICVGQYCSSTYFVSLWLDEISPLHLAPVHLSYLLPAASVSHPCPYSFPCPCHPFLSLSASGLFDSFSLRTLV